MLRVLLEEEFPPSRLQTVSEAINGLFLQNMGGKRRLIHALLRSHGEVLADWQDNKVFQILTILRRYKPQSELNGYHTTRLSPTLLPPATLNISGEEIIYC